MFIRGAPVAVVEGEVEPGDRRGRELGFPTANVHEPAGVRFDGVYAAILQVEPATEGPSYVAAVSVGRRPTFYGREGSRLLEAHVLDFTGDLYHKRVRLELHVLLRPQRRFPDPGLLVDQLRADVEATREWARANGCAQLLGNDRHRSESRIPGDGRRKAASPVVRRKKHSGAARSVERQRKREQLIQQAIDEWGAVETVPPEWLARRIGVPVAFARYHLASRRE